MDASPDVLAEEVRNKRHAIDHDLDRLRERLSTAGARRDDARRWALAALPLLAGTAALWQWQRRRSRVDTLDDLLRLEIRELYGIEQALVPALERMAELAASPDLAAAFDHHRGETTAHVERLQRVFRMLESRPGCGSADAVDSVMTEAERLLKKRAAPDVRDAWLIASAQKLEHLEIAGYGTARTHAETLGFTAAGELLQQTLDEERAADDKLSQLARRFVNPDAMRGARDR